MLVVLACEGAPFTEAVVCLVYLSVSVVVWYTTRTRKGANIYAWKATCLPLV